MTDFYKEKMLIDVTGRPIPQHYDEEKGVFVANTNGTGDATGVDFRKKKMLIDVQSFPIPQYYNVVEGVFKPITSEGSSGGSGILPGVPIGAIVYENINQPTTEIGITRRIELKEVTV